MKKSFKIIICIMIIMMIDPTTVLAHPGRTDSKGCHTCKTNCSSWGLDDYEYHCHSGNTYTNSKGDVYNKSGTKISSGGSSNNSTSTKVKYVYGCTDKEAKNYNSKANKDDGKCEYYVYGCTDKEAKNYNENAEKDDDSCEYYKYGCMDKNAINYDKLAEKDDDSCEYEVITNNNSLDTPSKTSEDDSSGIGSLITLGGIGAAAYYMKKKK